MSMILQGKDYEYWKETILADLDNHPMTFTQLSKKYGIEGGSAQESPEYYKLLDVVSKMQNSRNKEPLIGTALSTTDGKFFLYRKDQEAQVTIDGLNLSNLRDFAIEEGFSSPRQVITLRRKER